jgi:WD40 repeat protein
MSLSRRQFVRTVASLVAAGWCGHRPLVLRGQARAISWPSRVVQLPPDDEDHTPPVVTALRLHRDGQQLATAGDDHCVRIWSPADGKLIHKLRGHSDWVRSVDYSPDGQLLASAGNDRQIILWEAATGAQVDVLATHPAAIAAIRFSHDGKLLAAVGFESQVRLYDMTTRRLAGAAAAPCQDVRALALSHDDKLLAIGGRCGAIRLLALPQGELVRDIPAHRQRIRALAFSSDGTYVASSGEDRAIHVAPVSGGVGESLPSRAKVLAIAFYGPRQLATAGSDNVIRLWDVATRSEIGCLLGHTGSIAALECQGKVLVSAGYDTTVRIWDVGDQIASGPQPGRIGTRPVEPKVGR